MKDFKTAFEQIKYENLRQMMLMFPLALNLGKPDAVDDDHFVANTDMKNGEYTLAETEPDVPRNVRVEVTKETENDTMGELLVKGKDILGNEIQEVIEPNNGDTSSGVKEGDLAFAGIESITGSGWEEDTAADKIKIGFGNKLGLPLKLADTASILVNVVDNAVQTYTAAVDDPASVAGTTIDAQSGGGSYDGSNSVVVLVKPEDPSA